MIEKLKKLGLTSYEAKAYLALLKLGDAEASEIAINAKIPLGRIYGVFASLEEANLIHAQDTRPKRYGCVEPAAAIERLSKNKHEELKQKAVQIEVLVNDLKSELSGIVVRKPAETFLTVVKGEESLQLIQEYIMGAQTELLFFSASRMTSERIKKGLIAEEYSGIIAALDKSLKKGVDIKVILNKDVDFSVFNDFPAVKQVIMQMGTEIRLAAIPEATSFDIIDGENLLLRILNPLNPDELFAVINIRDTILAEKLRKKFFTIWEKAEICSGKK